MKRIIIIGNASNGSGPAKIVMSLYKELASQGKNVKLIDTNKSRLTVLLQILSLLFNRGDIINVHSFGYKIPSIVLKISKLNYSNDYYLTLHGIYTCEPDNDIKPKIAQLEKKLINDFPKIICVSHLEKKVLLEKYHRADNVLVVYNGVDPISGNRIKNNHKKLRMITAGGYSIGKNTLGIIKYIELARNEGIDARLTICGTNKGENYYKECMQYIKEHNLEDFIDTTHCYMSQSELAELYLQNTHYISLSIFDTFNLAALEAMQLGLPVIVSRHNGISEIIGCGGIITEQDNAVDTIHKLTELNYAKMSQCAYEIGKKHTVKQMAIDYLMAWGLKNE